MHNKCSLTGQVPSTLLADITPFLTFQQQSSSKTSASAWIRSLINYWRPDISSHQKLGAAWQNQIGAWTTHSTPYCKDSRCNKECDCSFVEVLMDPRQAFILMSPAGDRCSLLCGRLFVSSQQLIEGFCQHPSPAKKASAGQYGQDLVPLSLPRMPWMASAYHRRNSLALVGAVRQPAQKRLGINQMRWNRSL